MTENAGKRDKRNKNMADTAGDLIESIYKKFGNDGFPKLFSDQVMYKKPYISKISDFVQVFFPLYSLFIQKNITEHRQFSPMKEKGFWELGPYVMDEDKEINTEEKPLDEFHEECGIYKRYFALFKGKIKLVELRKLILREFLLKKINISRGKSVDMRSWKELLKDNVSDAAQNIKEGYAECADKMIIYIEGLPNSMELLSEDSIDGWVDAFYYYVYYVVLRTVHYNITMTSYPNWDADLSEYNRIVVEMYGNSSDPGYFRIFEIANRKNNPNIIAMFELADKYYYGFTYAREINYQKAYNYYNKVLELHPEHSLALWSLAFIRFHYKPINNHKYRIEELEEEWKEKCSWNERIVEYAVRAYQLRCPPAVNFIGKILESNREELRELLIEKLALSEDKTDVLFWFREAAQRGYLFAYNNCAKHLISRAQKKEYASNIFKEMDYYTEACEYLEHTVELGEPWACNYLANTLLYDGVKSMFDKRRYVVKPDKKRAYDLYVKAMGMRQKHYFWPLINLCNKFWLNPKSNHYQEIPYSRVQQEISDALKDNEVDKGTKEELKGLNHRIKEFNEKDWGKGIKKKVTTYTR